MMKTSKTIFTISILFFFSSGIYFIGCSKSKKVAPVAVDNLAIHPVGWVDTLAQTSNNFHATYLRNNGWTIGNCARCHGADLNGGSTGVGCLNCHSNFNSCNTCHGNKLGNPADPVSWAPPSDLNGDVPTSYKTVGAHQRHLLGSGLADAILCSECHQAPASVTSTGHLDLTPGAEVIFGTVTTDTTQGVHPNPTYDRTTATCSGTYCHGNFNNGNTTNAPLWTGGTVQAACGSCHGLPPKTAAQGGTHPPSSGLLNCYTCHSSVISNTGSIINKSLHVNGVINF